MIKTITLTAWAIVAMATTCSASLIRYQSPADVTGPLSVLNNGDAFLAIDAAGVGGLVNGVQFVGDPALFAVTTSGEQATFSGFFTGGTTGNAILDLILSTGTYTRPDVSPAAATLNLNDLTIGNTYQVQLFFVDDRAPLDFRMVSLDGDPHARNIDYSRPIPTSIVGTFTADSALQSILLSTHDPSLELGALVVRTVAVPEPTALMGIGLVGAIAMSRRRSR